MGFAFIIGAIGMIGAVGHDVSGAEAADTVATLHEIEVAAPVVPGGFIRSGGKLTMLRGSLLEGMRSLGVADAVTQTRTLPGFQPGSDYSSGVTVNGTAASHTSYTIDGTPVFFPFHFGGIFSTFIPSHFSRYSISGFAQDFRPDMRVGGYLDAVADDALPTEVSGTADVGILSSALTLAVPVGSRTGVTASARTSYIDAIYSRLVDTDESTTRYGLTDLNLTAVHAFDEQNTLKVNGFANFDRVRFADYAAAQRTSMRWSNALGNAVWRHRGEGIDMRHTLGYSQMANRLAFDMSHLSVEMPAAVRQAAFSGKIDTDAWHIGYGADYTTFEPQSVNQGTVGLFARQSDFVDYRPADGEDRCYRLHSWTAQAYAARALAFGEDRSLDLGARLSTTGTGGGRCFMRLDPRAEYTIRRGRTTIGAELSAATQYIQQVGIADIGMSADFWLPPVAPLRPLHTYNMVFRCARERARHGLGYYAEVFGRIVRNEAEYRGNLLDVMAEGYDALRCVTMGRGYDLGCNLAVEYSLGLTYISAGYSFAMGCRHYPDTEGWLHSSNEPLHSLKLSASHRVGRNLHLSAFFTMSSGRVYTPVEAVYIIAGNILTEYGRRNSARLPMYHRLDVSAMYDLGDFKLGGRACSHFATLSLLNAYGSRNVEMQYFVYNIESQRIALHRVYSLYRFLPSLSYTLRF